MAAALAADRVVHLFDARGSKVDRFDTRPADKAATNAHSVTALALSPDASRVAVAQSDNMVVVYHLGLAKTDKKVVYRKFPTTAPVASVLWPSDVADTFFYGQIDGRVRVAHVDLNKAGTLFDRKRFPVSVTAISCTAACVAAAAQTTEIALINREGNLVRADRLSDGKSITLEAANENGEALKITEFVVYENRFLVAYTTDKQLILADVEQQKVSTITPTWAGSTRFVFDSQGVCLAHHSSDGFVASPLLEETYRHSCYNSTMNCIRLHDNCLKTLLSLRETLDFIYKYIYGGIHSDVDTRFDEGQTPCCLSSFAFEDPVSSHLEKYWSDTADAGQANLPLVSLKRNRLCNSFECFRTLLFFQDFEQQH
ncbi:putative intraflagellar transport protein [Toxoplasma gondii GAB2-2007-GAL-DOM2]|uniref:Putative intraflagellar transport protein n=1 Tax=Toxoplasma gondii GAB2-2007-GAL-DOM2 TaxID=1130820 RepID=A0A086KF27_TOXGO|nr:putative intraflagellar transport protein [Toxoplasma gondii GAB2-2007-GAL-DOM2]